MSNTQAGSRVFLRDRDYAGNQVSRVLCPRRTRGYCKSRTSASGPQAPPWRCPEQLSSDIAGFVSLLDDVLHLHPVGEGRWCTDLNGAEIWLLSFDSASDRERSRTTKLSHAVENVAGESSFDRLGVRTASAESITEDCLVSKEGVLDATLPMIAGLLLPFPSTHLVNLANSPVAGWRWRMSDAS